MARMNDRPHDEAMTEHFRADSNYAETLLAELRRDGALAELAILLRQLSGEGADVDSVSSPPMPQ